MAWHLSVNIVKVSGFHDDGGHEREEQRESEYVPFTFHCEGKDTMIWRKCNNVSC